MHGIQIQTLDLSFFFQYLEQQWKIQVNQFQLQNMGPAYFIDIHFVQYNIQNKLKAICALRYSHIYWGGGDFKYAQKNRS